LKSISRRDFLSATTRIAGTTYPAMLALGLLKQAPAPPFNLPGNGKGKHILILGAGLAGLCSGYELQKLGYTCTILEARERSGGRCWSIRKGSTNKETALPVTNAGFDEGLYFNAGPSRIPHHHQLTMHYCKLLKVPLQVYNNVNESAYYFSEGKGKLSNKKIRVREIHNDIRGYMSELLSKSFSSDAIQQPFTREDAQKVLEYLSAEGGLDIDKLYKASARRGYTEHPGAGNKEGKIGDPYALADIIRSGLMDPDFYNVAEYTYELQMTMFQAIGGMDKIALAFEKALLPGTIQFQSVVTEIINTSDGVVVTYSNKEGNSQVIKADLCICTIPLPVLSNINHNFSSSVSKAIDYIPYIAAGKIGLQFKRRFWEEDEAIYGGITHTNNELTQIFYPSNDYQQQKGILIGYYNFNEKAKSTGELNYQQREALALQKGSLIHPQYAREFETSFSVTWHKTVYNMGGWAIYSNEERQTFYQSLLKPEKNVYFTGEHMTYLNAWMAGALESARSTVTDIHARVSEQRLQYP
jgi:monoamine oxidase